MSDLRLTVRRESADKDVSKAFRKVSLKVHPDKGGNLGDFQKLSAANDTWKHALKNRGVPGRPRSAEEPAHRKPKPAAKRGQLEPPDATKGFRIQSEAVLLTCQGFLPSASESRRRLKLRVGTLRRNCPSA